MRGYGLPRNDDVQWPDLYDQQLYGLRSGIDPDGRPYRPATRSTKNRNSSRRIWRRAARREGRDAIFASIQALGILEEDFRDYELEEELGYSEYYEEWEVYDESDNLDYLLDLKDDQKREKEIFDKVTEQDEWYWDNDVDYNDDDRAEADMDSWFRTGNF